MKRSVWLCTVLVALLPHAALAEQAAYDDCILKYLKGAKVDYAAQLIRTACEENTKNASLLSKRRIDYNRCLLENLVGVESERAVFEIKRACSSKHETP